MKKINLKAPLDINKCGVLNEQRVGAFFQNTKKGALIIMESWSFFPKYDKGGLNNCQKYQHFINLKIEKRSKAFSRGIKLGTVF